MHQTRQTASIKLPIPRKGTKYVARAFSHLQDSVPVVIAVRDMLHLAHTAKEVKNMIKERDLKINWRPVKDLRESIKLFNIFEADKTYKLTLLPTGKFAFKELNKKEDRLCKVIDKRLVKKGAIQLNLHDGSNILTNQKNIATGDSVYLGPKGEIIGHIPIEKGREVFIISGKHKGRIGRIESIENRKVKVKYDGSEAFLDKKVLVIIK